MSVTVDGVDDFLSKAGGMAGKVGSSRVLFFAVTDTQKNVAERVWDRGLTTDGQPIGYLEDYEVYVYKPPFPRAPSGTGKPFDLWKKPPPSRKKGTKLVITADTGSERSFGRARKIKGGYAPTYLAAKEQQGRRDTPLDLTSAYRKNYIAGTAIKELDGGLTCTISLSGVNVDKWRGMTNQKGEHLKLSEAERQAYTKKLQELWDKEPK